MDEGSAIIFGEELKSPLMADVQVARGLLHNGILDDLETSALNQVVTILLSERCPSARDLTEKDKTELGKLALPN